MPRGLHFLFDRNRFNVAVSRAQCLAVVVVNPRLLDADCRTLESVQLVDGACRFVEMAAPVDQLEAVLLGARWPSEARGPLPLPPVRAYVLHCVRGIEQTGRVIEADVEVGLSLATLHEGGPLARTHVYATHAALGEVFV